MSYQGKRPEQVEYSEKVAIVFLSLSVVFILVSFLFKTTELLFLFVSISSVAAAYHYHTSKQ